MKDIAKYYQIIICNRDGYIWVVIAAAAASASLLSVPVLVTVTVTVVLSPELLPSVLFPAETGPFREVGAGNTVVFLLLLTQSFQLSEFPYRHSKKPTII
jgi:hypothetical protein